MKIGLTEARIQVGSFTFCLLICLVKRPVCSTVSIEFSLVLVAKKERNWETKTSFKS